MREEGERDRGIGQEEKGRENEGKGKEGESREGRPLTQIHGSAPAEFRLYNIPLRQFLRTSLIGTVCALSGRWHLRVMQRLSGRRRHRRLATDAAAVSVTCGRLNWDPEIVTVWQQV